MKEACSSPTAENFPQLSRHYVCPISGLQSKWSFRDGILNLFARQVKQKCVALNVVIACYWQNYFIPSMIIISYYHDYYNWLCVGLLVLGKTI